MCCFVVVVVVVALLFFVVVTFTSTYVTVSVCCYKLHMSRVRVCFRIQNGDHLRNMGKIWGNGDQYHDDDGILTCIHVYTIFSDNLC